MNSRIGSWRAKAAAVGSAAVVAALCLTITPAQADSPGGGGSLMPKPGVGVVPQDTDDWSTPEGLAKYLSGCPGDTCTFVPLEKIGDPVYGTPTRVGTPSQNCSATETATQKFEEAETIGETTTVGLSIAGLGATAKVDQSWFKSNTVSNALTGTLAPHQTGWFESVPVTQKAKGTWKIAGVSETNPFGTANKYTAVGPREFHDVDSDITYKLIRFQPNDMTADEVKNLCGKDGPV
ncbi:hypothetical protein SLV14_005441 [Streptomyces sp. Je 1-4]|uniref:hypothetical protein n=1 Tax=Streptomyces TaxID=1883 RepID=UPI0021D9EF99|nr:MULTISPECIES: hypothetical protein [unclassified Streptomyces]UYB42556.1 hypothetical protein SLV14_005441 [Streptomyces sp. Je 1-4]UZQ38872.1 hypothetical protein SLV14N_005441 [Streptomyces sp. Je 1-4] [Streptomyces sp. Je 1-4 4N24]UZQ46289.1 hypothetical protein SLV14NA_005441 [Streptomyces sp. Je 1-4] [Streptomyces sp. Je 1-4 4N24_ara]